VSCAREQRGFATVTAATHPKTSARAMNGLIALAKAAATSHQQVRIAMLTRQSDSRQARIVELEASLRALGQEHLVGRG